MFDVREEKDLRLFLATELNLELDHRKLDYVVERITKTFARTWMNYDELEADLNIAIEGVICEWQEKHP